MEWMRCKHILLFCILFISFINVTVASEISTLSLNTTVDSSVKPCTSAMYLLPTQSNAGNYSIVKVYLESNDNVRLSIGVNIK